MKTIKPALACIVSPILAVDKILLSSFIKTGDFVRYLSPARVASNLSVTKMDRIDLASIIDLYVGCEKRENCKKKTSQDFLASVRVCALAKVAPKPAEARVDSQVLEQPKSIKYGPVTVHQNGTAVKQLAATPTPIVSKSSRIAHSLENVRLSMHLERFESPERLSAEIKCITRFPEFGYELKHNAPCEMRVGQTHGAAVVQATCICVDFENARDTTMEVEYMLGDESLTIMTIPIKFPSDPDAEDAAEPAEAVKAP
jgi:hypothetical protein